MKVTAQLAAAFEHITNCSHICQLGLATLHSTPQAGQQAGRHFQSHFQSPLWQTKDLGNKLVSLSRFVNWIFVLRFCFRFSLAFCFCFNLNIKFCFVLALDNPNTCIYVPVKSLAADNGSVVVSGAYSACCGSPAPDVGSVADAALPSANAAMASKMLSPCIFLWTCLLSVCCCCCCSCCQHFYTIGNLNLF